jgi:hypothetical protein
MLSASSSSEQPADQNSDNERANDALGRMGGNIFLRLLKEAGDCACKLAELIAQLTPLLARATRLCHGRGRLGWQSRRRRRPLTLCGRELLLQ